MPDRVLLASEDSCTGCFACYSVCEKEAIIMKENSEGFLFPQIDDKKCVKCRRCINSCPVINRKTIEESHFIQTYAAYNKDDEIRAKSSSGGIFFSIASSIIRQGGVVFGVRWNDDWNVIHDFSESFSGIEMFMGSKYLQSRIGDSYKIAKNYLERGQTVLFTGTPCQIAALKHFLNKEYDNLLAVELLCMGVPSPKVWRKYLEEYKNKCGISIVEAVSFKNKSRGWLHQSFAVSGKTSDGVRENIIIPAKESPYYIGFDKCIFLRKSCYHCKYRVLDTFADITIGDCWNVNETCPNMFDDKGISTIICRTEKGMEMLNSISKELILCHEDNTTIAERISLPIEKRLNKGFQRRKDFFFYIKLFRFDTKVIRSVFQNDKPFVRIERKLKQLLSL